MSSQQTKDCQTLKALFQLVFSLWLVKSLRNFKDLNKNLLITLRNVALCLISSMVSGLSELTVDLI